MLRLLESNGRFLSRLRSPGASFCLVLLVLIGGAFSQGVHAADMDQARQAFYRGDYDSCIEISRAEVEKGVWNVFWARQLIDALMVTGRYDDAREVYEIVAPKFPTSLPLRMQAADAYRFCGQHEVAARLLDEIPQMVNAQEYRFRDRDNLLAIGKYFLILGEDARDVLGYYDRILERQSKFVDAHVAIAELALTKSDYQEAVKSLKVAADLRPEDPAIQYMMAKAWAPSDSEQAADHLATALQLNPSHPESLLLQVENMINAEDYDGASELIEEVLQLNDTHAIALAFQASIAHLKGEYTSEGEFRKKALQTWELNPAVDYQIGKTLSQHYRFEEGVKYQRRSLRLDPGYVPARFQLAQDLLRLGKVDEGWTLVDQVSSADKYNVVAFNLKTLQGRLAEFSTLESDGLLVRMNSREARIYGPRVLELLQEAKAKICEKYDMPLTQPVTVEIFPQQSDFAIRTFGLPGGAGFLGVCFGSLITANSPASQGETPANWESVLWHEFCHVVTLQKTNNRMPRWLSEGISVYEELERDSSWGQRMTPLYKSMLLGEDFVPLSQLSGAFLNPKSPMHLQFAYFESSLAIRYLVDTHGLPLLRRLLVDLGVGVPMAEAFERRYGDAKTLDADFKRFVQEEANSFAPEADFFREGLPEKASRLDLEAWLSVHEGSYFARRQLALRLMDDEQWEEAMEQLQLLDELFPNDVEPEGTLELMAACARELDNESLERETLESIVRLSGDNLRAISRLLEIAEDNEQWDDLQSYANRFLAVQPLVVTGHESVVLASRKLGRLGDAADSLRALQEMDPADPAGLHFELAEALVESEEFTEARNEVLLALEHSPRFREAQKLLVRIYNELHSVEPVELNMNLPEVAKPPAPVLPSQLDVGEQSSGGLE